MGWYGSSYLLTTTALQPSFGRIYTYFNVKYTYIFALCLFELGSIICAAAKNSVMLIVGRAVAGAGASALFSGGMTIVGFTVPLKKRPIFIAALSSMFGISSVVGPLLGGVFTDKLSWRWCFWVRFKLLSSQCHVSYASQINLPFGAVSIAVVWLFFKAPQRKNTGLTTKQKILDIDLLGALFLICAIVCLLLALQWGGTTYPWKNSKVWGCLLGFALLISIFIAQQFRRGDRATIPPRIFRQRTVLFACLYSCFLSMALYVRCKTKQLETWLNIIGSYILPALLFPSCERYHGRRLWNPDYTLSWVHYHLLDRRWDRNHCAGLLQTVHDLRGRNLHSRSGDHLHPQSRFSRWKVGRLSTSEWFWCWSRRSKLVSPPSHIRY